MTCAACGRTFGGLTGFDKHQELRNGKVWCHEPEYMTRKDGSPLFKLDARDRWVLVVGKAHPHA